MDMWKPGLFLAALWIVGIVISFKKKKYPDPGSLFERQGWSVWNGIFAATFLELTTVFALWTPWTFRNRPVIVIFYMFAEILFFASILFYYRARLNQSYRVIGLSPENLGINLLFGLRWLVRIFLVLYGVFFLLLRFQSVQASQDWLMRLSRQRGIVYILLNFFEKMWGTGSLLMPILFMVLFRPLMEEIVFRGLLYGPVRKKTDPVMATLLTTVLFTLAHESYNGHYLFSGLLFAFLYERTESLIPGIVVHGFINLGSVLYFFERKSVVLVPAQRAEAGWITLFLVVLSITIEVVFRLMTKKGYRWKRSISTS